MARLTQRSPPAGAWARRRAALAGLLGMALVWLGPGAGAQEARQAAEYEVKAAFLYKFASYVEWPPQVFAEAGSPFAIGVAGADLLADALARIVAQRTIDGRPVEIRKLRRGDPVDGLQILFVGRDGGERLSDFLDSARGRPVLTVSESEDAFALGSMINFVVVDDKVRFDVALREAEHANLKVSSRLLSVARKVRTGPS
jgi:hypothetical protein